MPNIWLFRRAESIKKIYIVIATFNFKFSRHSLNLVNLKASVMFWGPPIHIDESLPDFKDQFSNCNWIWMA